LITRKGSVLYVTCSGFQLVKTPTNLTIVNMLVNCECTDSPIKYANVEARQTNVSSDQNQVKTVLVVVDI